VAEVFSFAIDVAPALFSHFAACQLRVMCGC
jgi:hypothetical protein